MDLLTHTAAGTFIGWAWPQSRPIRFAVPLAIAGALLPDADNIVAPFLDPESGGAHRAFTHSLIGVAVLAPLAAFIVSRLTGDRRFALPAVLIAVAMLSHLLLDLPTPMGVMLFFPSREYVTWGFLGYLDWTLFILSLFVLLAAWTYASRRGALRRGILAAVLLSALSWWLFSEWPTLALLFAGTVEEATEQPLSTIYPLVLGGMLVALLIAFARSGWGFRQSRSTYGRIGVGALSIYLVLCVTAQGMALGVTQKFARERGVVASKEAASRMGYSSLFAPLRWTGLILAPEGVYTATIPTFGASDPAFTLFPTSALSPIVAGTRTIPKVRDFMSTARFPVTRYRLEKAQHIVEYQEYGLSWRPLLRVVLDERQKVVTVGWIAH
jgi:membrane-bound metal-dependent hydrolase YbcI (DUF457 family)